MLRLPRGVFVGRIIQSDGVTVLSELDANATANAATAACNESDGRMVHHEDRPDVRSFNEIGSLSIISTLRPSGSLTMKRLPNGLLAGSDTMGTQSRCSAVIVAETEGT